MKLIKNAIVGIVVAVVLVLGGFYGTTYILNHGDVGAMKTSKNKRIMSDIKKEKPKGYASSGYQGVKPESQDKEKDTSSKESSIAKNQSQANKKSSVTKKKSSSTKKSSTKTSKNSNDIANTKVHGYAKNNGYGRKASSTYSDSVSGYAKGWS